MSTAQSSQPGQQQPGGLTLELASNNPFRNRTTSPLGGAFGNKPNTPTSPFDDPIPPRPASRNPFLDPFSIPPEPVRSPGVMSTQSDKGTGPTAEELFDSLTIEDKKPGPGGDGNHPMNRPRGPPGPPRGGGPLRGRGGPNHRPTRSQEEALRARKMQGGGPARPGGSSTSPHKRMERRPRRNSDSSLLDADKPLTEEEKKAREARRREREKRHREGKDKTRTRRLDVIDQLDATSILGTGAFHHDGPFDACNPNRNRKGSRRAPMNAFAKDSANNSIGGSGPLNKRPDHAVFMGNADDEAFKDYSQGSTGPKNKNGYNLPNPSQGELPVFDPMSRGAVLHGDESLGLGTSTFLEGTPAARTVIQRREAEQAAEIADGGLQRKKSLAQRIRSINRGPREYGPPPPGRITSPEGVYGSRRSPDPMPLTAHAFGAERAKETNPFFSEYGNEPETISVKKAGADPASPSSPQGRPRQVSSGLERRATTDAIGSSPESEGKTGGGLLARVKSLKGGRKPRNASGDGAPNPPSGSGTAV